MSMNKQAMNRMLQEMDDECIANGQPPLSVLVVHDDGAVSTAFIQTVAEHNLRLPGETDAQLVARYRELAYIFHNGALK